MNNLIDKYLEESGGEWNNSLIDSDILRIHESGYAPKFRGGCIGIIPNNDKFLILGEDDDHYFDICNISKLDLFILKDILKELSESVVIKIDYIKCISKTKYFPNKDGVFNRNYSIDKFKVTITDRGNQTSPLVEIKNNDINLDMTFDISWSKEKYNVINQIE